MLIIFEIFIINLFSIFLKINDFEPKTQYFEVVLGIRGGPPMNESYLLRDPINARPPQWFLPWAARQVY